MEKILIDKKILEYVKHEFLCKCISENKRFDESECDCGLYQIIKDFINNN